MDCSVALSRSFLRWVAVGDIFYTAMEFASRPWENAAPADDSYQNKMNW
jgi:hypothetical protein